MPETAKFVVDPRSARVVLRYVGEDNRSARNAPPTDITEHGLARLAYVERMREIAQDVGQPIDHEKPDGPKFERPDPRSPDPDRVGAIVEELVASGRFELVEAAKASTKKPARGKKAPAEAPAAEKDEPTSDAGDEPADTPQPDAPAPEPEG